LPISTATDLLLKIPPGKRIFINGRRFDGGDAKSAPEAPNERALRLGDRRRTDKSSAHRRL
jgi:hypothetical protein